MTLRAILCGVLFALFISIAVYFNDQVIAQTYLIGNHFPIIVFGFLILLVIGVNPLLAYIMPDIVNALTDLIASVVHFDLGKVLWPFREAGGWPGHANAIGMTLVILLIVKVLTKARVILKL